MGGKLLYIRARAVTRSLIIVPYGHALPFVCDSGTRR